MTRREGKNYEYSDESSKVELRHDEAIMFHEDRLPMPGSRSAIQSCGRANKHSRYGSRIFSEQNSSNTTRVGEAEAPRQMEQARTYEAAVSLQIRGYL
jgi:hypothetical protein